jgi:DNA-binding MarR family transcriptional regulator
VIVSSKETGHELAMRLRAAYSFFRRRSSAELAPLRSSSDQFVLLTVLAVGGPATQQELVRRCHSDTNTLGAMLALLETKGLVRRKANTADGRAWIVSLTKAGKALQEELWNQSEGLRAELAALFDPNEITVLLSLLDRVIEAMRPERRLSRKLHRGVNGSREHRVQRKTERQL